MPGKGEKKEGLVGEILKKDHITTKELKEELGKKNVNFTKLFSRSYGGLLFVVAIIWLLPAVAQYSGCVLLNFFARLPVVEFPIPVIVIGAIFFIAAISLEAKVTLIRKREGGCHDTHETVIVIREGPYRIIRHPGHLAEMSYFSLLPILLSRWVPFTVMAGISIVILITGYVYMIREEDNFNIRKWGEEYTKYMKELPAVNFFKGLNNLKRFD
jgi:protein-S-isoprenylcysteine O-methyltransferase Ste14